MAGWEIADDTFCDCTIAFNGTAKELYETETVYHGDPQLVCSHFSKAMATAIRLLEEDNGYPAHLMLVNLADELGYMIVAVLDKEGKRND